jgi:hypothetical protein
MMFADCVLPRQDAEPLERVRHWAFVATALVLMILTVRGVASSYSPVPLTDMWDGTLGFYMRVQDGDWRAWLAQHNEHRIVLSRVLFWIDHRWLGASGWLLLGANLLLLLAIAGLFARFIREGAGDTYRWFTWFVAAWLFLWTQWENLGWGFQSQFYFAYLLPLAALYFLHRAAHALSGRSTAFFIAALTCGIAALGSMANGVLALPLMALYAWLTGMSRARIALIIVAAILCISIYFAGYIRPEPAGSVGGTVLADPVGVLRYVARFLGSPLFHLSGETPWGRTLAEGSGFLLMILAALSAGLLMVSGRRSTVETAMICFLVYIGAAALATATGRLKIGLEFALSSRYTTPALLAWASLATLWLCRKRHSLPMQYAAVPLVLALYLMLSYQGRAVVGVNDAPLFQRATAALALALGVRDEQVIKPVFPFVEVALQIAAKASERDAGIFERAPYRDARELLGTRRSIAEERCLGHLDEVRPVAGDPDYLFVRGWLGGAVRGGTGDQPRRLVLLDAQSNVSGVLVHGQRRDDVAAAIHSDVANSGFAGYVRRTLVHGQAYVQDEEARCSLPVELPAPIYSIRAPGHPSTPTVRASDVQVETWGARTSTALRFRDCACSARS